LHGELALLVDAGLAPAEALAAATSFPAEKFHLADRGRIRSGLRADLVLVEGDPTHDILATRNIVNIWKRGVPVDREEFKEANSAARVASTQTTIEDGWQGTLHAGDADLHLVLHVSKGPDGLKATLDSVDQGANDIPVSTVSLKEGKLSLRLEAVGGSYEGTLSPDGSTIDGTWTQQGQSYPLTFKRIETRPKPNL
jgi:hypothetical protein